MKSKIGKKRICAKTQWSNAETSLLPKKVGTTNWTPYFQPYSGVSTAVLVFTKTNSGGTDKVWFYDMKADGYTLDQKRTECKENDIPDVLARWENLDAESSRTRKEQSFMVSADEIRQNDYDLSFNKYREVERERIEYEAPDKIFARIEQQEAEIAGLMKEYKEKFL